MVHRFPFFKTYLWTDETHGVLTAQILALAIPNINALPRPKILSNYRNHKLVISSVMPTQYGKPYNSELTPAISEIVLQIVLQLHYTWHENS